MENSARRRRLQVVDRRGWATRMRALGGVALAAMPRLEIIEAAALASRAVEKARLFIIMVSLLRHAGWWEGCCRAGALRVSFSLHLQRAWLAHVRHSFESALSASAPAVQVSSSRALESR